MKLSGAQRRQALSIPINVQYRTRDDEETDPGTRARMDRAAVVIGGGHNYGRIAHTPGRGRHQAHSSQQGGMHHSRSEPQIRAGDAGGDGPEVGAVARSWLGR